MLAVVRFHYPALFGPGQPFPDAETLAVRYAEFLHLAHHGFAGLGGGLKQ